MLINPLLLAAATATVLAGEPAQAVKPADAQVVKALFACRGLSPDPARLACYDQAAGALVKAEAAGDVVVVDRERVGAVRREAFGFRMPSLSLLPHAADRPLDRITVALASAGRNAEGKWLMTTQQDAQWIQTDSEDFETPPSKGSTLTVRSGALGSYFCKIDRQIAVRCQRRR